MTETVTYPCSRPVFAGLSAFTVGTAVAGASPFVSASSPVLSSPTGIGWSFEWDDDDDDWSQPAYWECPAACSIT